MPISRPSLRKALRMLVVDDDEAALELIRSFFPNEDVHTATNAEDALRLARGGRFDVFLVDKNLPDEKAGIDLLRKILEADSCAVVVVVTAFGSAEAPYEAVRAGASAYLAKPFPPAAEVVRCVEEAIARSEQRRRAVEHLREARRHTGEVTVPTPTPPPDRTRS